MRVFRSVECRASKSSATPLSELTRGRCLHENQPSCTPASQGTGEEQGCPYAVEEESEGDFFLSRAIVLRSELKRVTSAYLQRGRIPIWDVDFASPDLDLVHQLGIKGRPHGGYSEEGA
ncbi:hypothetical protein NDU88_006267 [Pleurodeles waltl]|uniref:Uncharacterized protein n=1 Tax=Pleurodeles waltl TaxID=8319 RepID=A0AAV7SP04_PLEWA|nr:hypothetical protein NDU88_006267 [Pleurodeles waltl]